MKNILFLFLMLGVAWCAVVQKADTKTIYLSDTVIFYDNPFSTADSLKHAVENIKEIQSYLPVHTLISYQNDLYTVQVPFGPAMHHELIHDDITEIFEFIQLAKWELLDL